MDNVVQANILALSTEDPKNYGQMFNIGTGGQYSILDLISSINKGLGTNIKPILGKNRHGDIPHSNADINKAKTLLCYYPKVDFNDGLRKLTR